MSQHLLSFNSWLHRHLLLPLITGLLLLIVLHLTQVDLILAQWLFHQEGNAPGWSLRHNYFLEHILHNGGRHVVTLLSLTLLVTLALSFFKPSLKPWRKDLLLLLANVAISILLVRFGKEYTNVSCPWDVIQFGGSKPWIPFPNSLFSSMDLGQCFPGGHSSGAFAWVALYYFALPHMPARRFKFLSFAIILGSAFAICQELRGAHFLTHDLTSLLLCWVVATLGYGIVYRPWCQRQSVKIDLPNAASMRV